MHTIEGILDRELMQDKTRTSQTELKRIRSSTSGIGEDKIVVSDFQMNNNRNFVPSNWKFSIARYDEFTLLLEPALRQSNYGAINIFVRLRLILLRMGTA